MLIMFLNKVNVPYCLVVFFVFYPRLRPFWGVFGKLALFWCSTATRKTRQNSDSRRVCHSSERSVGGIANQVNGHGTATSLLWISGGIEAGGNFPAELFALSDRHFGNHCSTLSFPYQWNTKTALTRRNRLKTDWDVGKQQRIQQGNKVHRFYVQT